MHSSDLGRSSLTQVGRTSYSGKPSVDTRRTSSSLYPHSSTSTSSQSHSMNPTSTLRNGNHPSMNGSTGIHSTGHPTGHTPGHLGASIQTNPTAHTRGAVPSRPMTSLAVGRMSVPVNRTGSSTSMSSSTSTGRSSIVDEMEGRTARKSILVSRQSDAPQERMSVSVHRASLGGNSLQQENDRLRRENMRLNETIKKLNVGLE